MRSELLDRKMDKAFKHLDIDGNGHVEREDLIALATRIMANFGEAPTSTKGVTMLDAFETFWQELIAATDTDRDGRIDPEEWRAGMVGAFVTERGGFERGLRPAVNAVLQLADTDGDGVMGVEEFVVLQRAFGTPEAEARDAFRMLDADGNGHLDVDELANAARQFYTSADDNAVGNWFFGPVAVPA
ncbi:calcium-binding protein [Actinosynnema sp. ALI-1.44]|uniref:EF-hand domain-containing protein n=1 Tax=Actinosynnema sp. ALI-1.44 TaxID=1933779 RepID=UPI00097C86F3|nr:EF-hand domain-containing protein [Actinosynnema sp. ALI-1.44]ONI77854.1 calcium-binding protein [Actinosynnema sp. ALI-1.44]